MGLCGSKQQTDAVVNVGQQTHRNGSHREDVVNSPRAEETPNYGIQTSMSDFLHQLAGPNEMTQAEELETAEHNLKVLLLGAGESGKSTILQQLQILHQNGFSDQERAEFRPFVYENLLEVGRDIILARSKFSIELEAESQLTQADLDAVKAQLEDRQEELSAMSQFPADLANTIATLWNLDSTQSLLKCNRRSDFYLMDSANYFMENIARISDADYLPSDQDILRSRQKTSGIFDKVFDMGSKLKFHVYDIGGQRSERKKWIHCFNNVTLIIFCVSLSEYDQFLMEDKNQNRLQESLDLFSNIVNSRWFARTSMVLFLNKIDLFAEKIKHVPLERYFSDYTGGPNVNKAAKYILWRFVQLNRANLTIYPHVTEATDTSNIELVFAAIKEKILENTLKDSGVL